MVNVLDGKEYIVYGRPLGKGCSESLYCQTDPHMGNLDSILLQVKFVLSRCYGRCLVGVVLGCKLGATGLEHSNAPIRDFCWPWGSKG